MKLYVRFNAIEAHDRRVERDKLIGQTLGLLVAAALLIWLAVAMKPKGTHWEFQHGNFVLVGTFQFQKPLEFKP